MNSCFWQGEKGVVLHDHWDHFKKTLNKWASDVPLYIYTYTHTHTHTHTHIPKKCDWFWRIHTNYSNLRGFLKHIPSDNFPCDIYPVSPIICYLNSPYVESHQITVYCQFKLYIFFWSGGCVFMCKYVPVCVQNDLYWSFYSNKAHSSLNTQWIALGSMVEKNCLISAVH